MFSGDGDAVIWTQDNRGSKTLIADRSNLVARRANGMISTEEVLLHGWLGVEDT